MYGAVDLLTESGERARYVTSLLSFDGLLVQQGKAFNADGTLMFIVWAPLDQPIQAAGGLRCRRRRIRRQVPGQHAQTRKVNSRLQCKGPVHANQVRCESLTLTPTQTRLHHKRNNYLIADAKHASASVKQAFYSAYLPSTLEDLGCTCQRILAGTGPRVCACISGAMHVHGLLHVALHHIPSPVYTQPRPR